MKTIKITILFILTFICVNVIVAENIAIPNEIIVGFQKNRPELIVKHLNDHVELILEDKNDIYSKQQATGIITNFFMKNPVQQFQILHKGDKDNAGFLIGTLKTQNTSYRVYVFVRKTNQNTNIQQIRIEQTGTIQ